jgi:hypothetical protein
MLPESFDVATLGDGDVAVVLLETPHLARLDCVPVMNSPPYLVICRACSP